MPLNSRHKDYTAMESRWRVVRAAINGSDAIKAGDADYLPRLGGLVQNEKTEARYQAYKKRAIFMEITGQTAESFLGFIYRKDPNIVYPKLLQSFIDDCTLTGLPWYDYLKARIREVIQIGRAGTFIEWDKAADRPFVKAYRAEEIINWRTGRVGNVISLTMLILEEESDKWHAETGEAAPDEYESNTYTQWREYRLRTVSEDSEPYVVCRVFRRRQTVASSLSDDIKPAKRSRKSSGDLPGTGVVPRSGLDTNEFVQIGPDTIPARRGTPLNFIPFIFHGPNNDLAAIDHIPMEGIAKLNIGHYCNSADLEHGLHFTSLPTFYAVGFDNADEVELGSTTALVADEPTGNEMIGFVEFAGAGLEAIEKGMDSKKADMAALGARLLDFNKKDVEAYETMHLRQTGETVTIGNIAVTGTQSGSKILRICAWWVTGANTPEDTKAVASTELNTDFVSSKITSDVWREATTAKVGGNLSSRAYFHLLHEGEVYPADWTFEKEQEAIAADGLTENPDAITGRPPVPALKDKAPPLPGPEKAKKPAPAAAA